MEEEFFPNLKRWVDPDLSDLVGAARVLQFPRRAADSIGHMNEDGSEILVGPWARQAALPFPEIMPWVTALRIAA